MSTKLRPTQRAGKFPGNLGPPSALGLALATSALRPRSWLWLWVVRVRVSDIIVCKTLTNIVGGDEGGGGPAAAKRQNQQFEQRYFTRFFFMASAWCQFHHSSVFRGTISAKLLAT